MSHNSTPQPARTSTLPPGHDPMGAAILDYQRTGRSGCLSVLSSMFDDDEMPVPHLFRSLGDMPALERKALDLARGRVLDVGAGAGCHALALQERGLAVKAIDISPLGCEAMRMRGVRDVECRNLFDLHLASTGGTDGEGFDTILLLMNGIGLAGKASGLAPLLEQLKSLLNEGGQILADSSDLSYLYEDEDGVPDIDPDAPYYGEVDFRMVYQGAGGHRVEGLPFDWLYADPGLLQSAARLCALRCDLVARGEHYDYLARITRQE